MVHSLYLKSFLDERKIAHCLSSVYYPQANGAVVRWNSVSKNALQNAVVKKESIKENVLQLIACYPLTLQQVRNLVKYFMVEICVRS